MHKEERELSANREHVISKSTVTRSEAAEILELVRICNAHEELDLKITLPLTNAGPDSAPRAYAYYADDVLIGYCALDYYGGPEAELCGAVHPGYRRHDIGRSLLDAASEACRSHGIRSLLVISEDASESGAAFVTALGAPRASTEWHMERDTEKGPLPRPATGTDQVQTRQATALDMDVVVRILADAFGDQEESVRRRVAQEIDDPDGPFVIGEIGGVPIGTLKMYRMGDETGIYAVGILPEWRGRGFGKQFIATAMQAVLSRGSTRFVLEVEPDNAAAISVYRWCGFEVTTRYGYYRLEL